MNRRILAACAGVVTVSFAPHLSAAPYAGTVSETTPGPTITFNLSEAADEVIILRDGAPTSLGALAAGTHSFARSGAANYSIVAVKNSGPGYQTEVAPNTAGRLQLSDDLSVFNQFERGVGMAINTNPATPNLFGRIYVTAPLNAPTVSGRPMTQGVFILNPDHTETIAGQGANGFTGGIAFEDGADPGAAVSPWRIALDEAGNVYIGDWSDGHGSVFRTGPDVGTSGGTNLFSGVGGVAPIAPTPALNHGSNAALAVTGSAAAGNLTVYVIDEDLSTTGKTSQLNSLWRFDVGSATANYSGTPTRLSGQLIDFTEGIIADLQRGGDGKFYMSQNRSVGSEAGVFVVASNGTTLLYDSLSDTVDHNIDVVDVLRQTRNIAVSPDQRFLAASTSQAGDVIVVPMLAGIPDVSNRLVLDAFNGSTNDAVAFDAAGNLSVVNRIDELLRTFSPGGRSVTSFNSDGTFSMDPTYTAGTGNYSTPASWLAGVVPNAANEVARFAGAGGGTVTVTAPITVGAIKFDSAASYTLGGGSTVTLQGGSPNVISQRGNHTIATPLLLTQSTGFVARNGMLTVSNVNIAPSPTRPVEIFTGGTGVVALGPFAAQSLYVVEGTTQSIASVTPRVTNVKRLRIAGGTTPIAKLDVTNNAFVVDYGVEGSPFETIRAQIVSGYNNGSWNGNGIISSNANGTTHGVGYAEASSLAGTVPPVFGTVDNDAVLFRHTRYGDANLDGTVNLADFNRLASNFGVAEGAVWAQGDFTYDGVINLSDFNRLAANFGQMAAGPEVTPQDWANLAAAVPEPSGAVAFALGASALVSRRRRRVM